MANVFLLYMPPGNAEAMVHYQDTIQLRVPLARVAPHVPANLRTNLISVFGNSSIPVWGSAGGPRNRANFVVAAPAEDLRSWVVELGRFGATEGLRSFQGRQVPARQESAQVRGGQDEIGAG